MNKDTQIEQQAIDALEQRAAALDGATLSKLRQARAHAVEQGLKRRQRWLTLWLPSAGLATAAAALLAINVWYVQPQIPGAPDPALLESLALEGSPPAFDELEFYDWLARDANGSA